VRYRPNGLLLRFRQGAGRHQMPPFQRVIRIRKPHPAVNHGLPRIHTRPVGPVVIRLQPLARQQFGVGNDKIQLHPAFIAVLHPEHAVLVFIESGHQNPFEALHQLFPLAGCKIRFLKRQHPGGVFLRIRRGVDQLSDFLRLALQHRCPLAVAVFAEQIIHRPGTAAAASGVEFNQHRRSRSPAPCAAVVQGRHRWPSARQ